MEYNISEHDDVAIRKIGWFMLIITWGLFVISINTFFKLWVYVIDPLKDTLYYEPIRRACEFADNTILTCWCIYVLSWWWAIVSWVGLKLFRHSKGVEADYLGTSGRRTSEG